MQARRFEEENYKFCLMTFKFESRLLVFLAIPVFLIKNFHTVLELLISNENG